MDRTPQTALAHDVQAGTALSIRRLFTSPDVHPFDEVEWEMRDAHIPGKDKTAFEQKDVEFPTFWSQTATNIVAQKYFRGRIGSPERERSVEQMIGRVVDTIADWGRDGRLLRRPTRTADTFEAELKAILVNQLAAFNSPVWFNVGFEESPQCSACMPYHALVSTPEGMVPIGELVEGDQVGREVYDSNGVTRIVAVKANGRKPVYRVTLRNGSSSRRRRITSSRRSTSAAPSRAGCASTSSSRACGCTSIPIARRSPSPRSWSPAAPEARVEDALRGRATSRSSRAPRPRSPAGSRPTASSASTSTARTAR